MGSWAHELRTSPIFLSFFGHCRPLLAISGHFWSVLAASCCILLPWLLSTAYVCILATFGQFLCHFGHFYATFGHFWLFFCRVLLQKCPKASRGSRNGQELSNWPEIARTGQMFWHCACCAIVAMLELAFFEHFLASSCFWLLLASFAIFLVHIPHFWEFLGRCYVPRNSSKIHKTPKYRQKPSGHRFWSFVLHFSQVAWHFWRPDGH